MADNGDRPGRIASLGLLGIAANVALALAKAAVGRAAGSPAIVADAVNNAADVLSSAVTVVGARLAAKGPDREHPLGHGRLEYVAALAVSLAVLASGAGSASDAVTAIVASAPASYDGMTVALVALGVAAKAWLSWLFLREGRRLSSPVLVDTGIDARLDVVASTATLACAVAARLGLPALDGWVALGISGLVCWSGASMLRDAVSDLTGRRVPAGLAQDVLAAIQAQPGVLGAYDLVMHSYGPDTYVASAHIEVDSSLSARDVDLIGRRVADAVLAGTGVVVAALGTYARDVGGGMHDDAVAAAEACDGVEQAHGFALVDGVALIDVVVPFDGHDGAAVAEEVAGAVVAATGAERAEVTVDRDVSGLGGAAAGDDGR